MSFEFGTIANDDSITDYETIQKFRKVEEAKAKKEKEIEKNRLKEDPDHTKEAFRYSHFICPRSNTIIPKFLGGVNYNDAEIEAHKADCPYCLEHIQKERAAKEAYKEGIEKMGFILRSIDRAKENIDAINCKIQKEQEERKENWELVIKHLNREKKEHEYTIEKEKREKIQTAKRRAKRGNKKRSKGEI